MKKIAFSFLVFVLIVLGVWFYTFSRSSGSSIGSTSLLQNKGIDLGIVTQQKQEESDFFVVDIAYPQTGFEKIDDVLEESLTSEVDQLKELVGESEDFISEFGIPYSLLGDYNVTRNDDRILSIRLDLYLYTGGAHGNGSTWTFVFDKEQDVLLTLQDLFNASTDYIAFLSNRSIEELSQREMLDNLEWLREGAGEDAFNFTNFILTETDFVIIFDAYQVGPYAAGSPEVAIGIDSLSDYLDPEYITL